MPDRILIVEDDVALNDWLCYELESDGYEIISVTDGLAGLTRAADRPDLILLDVNLPGMNGFQVSQTLQGHPDTAHIPIIFLTARATLEDRLTGFETGGADYLTKPFKMAELKARLKAALRRREVEQQRAQASLEQYKETLSQNISHELLTPMSIILSAIEMMGTEDLDKNSTKLDDVLDMAQAGANRLHWLIRDLLAMSKIVQNQVEVFRQPVELKPIVQSVLEQVSARYEQKKLNFDINVPAASLIHMMSNQVYEILHHLLDNACEFSPEEGRVELIAQPVGQTGVEIRVRDQGPGIEPDQHERIFEKFYQVDVSITSPSQGLGLGLYIARALARTYGGDVTVESKPRQGATFRFSLPDGPADKPERGEK